MVNQQTTPLRARMIPLGTLLRNALPGNGRYADQRARGKLSESTYPGGSIPRRVPSAVIRDTDSPYELLAQLRDRRSE